MADNEMWKVPAEYLHELPFQGNIVPRLLNSVFVSADFDLANQLGLKPSSN